LFSSFISIDQDLIFFYPFFKPILHSPQKSNKERAMKEQKLQKNKNDCKKSSNNNQYTKIIKEQQLLLIINITLPLPFIFFMCFCFGFYE